MSQGPDFTGRTKEILAKRAGQLCSNPDCRRFTSHAHSQDDKAVNLGEAAHIRAARNGEARFDASMSDADRRHISNAIWLCRVCAKKIDDDEKKYPVELLRCWKIEHEAFISSGGMPKATAAPVSVSGSIVHGDIAQQIIKISTSRRPKIAHPPGSIGADLDRRGYIDYLIGRYYDLRKADLSYGRNINFHHAVIHKNIQRTFGHKTFFNPVSNFEMLVDYLKKAIDGTIQGRKNRAKGIQNYHTFEEHIARIEKFRKIKGRGTVPHRDENHLLSELQGNPIGRGLFAILRQQKYGYNGSLLAMELGIPVYKLEPYITVARELGLIDVHKLGGYTLTAKGLDLADSSANPLSRPK